MDKFQSPTASWWGGSASQGLPSDWSNINGLQTLGVPATNWAAQQQGQWTFDERPSAGNGMSYDPLGASGVGYEPFSGFTSKMNYAAVNKYLQDAYPELFAFESEAINPGGGSAGTVARMPGYGQFAQNPEVWDAIQNSANKYGVPANLIQVFLARESSGSWTGGGNSGTPMFIGGQWQGYIHPFTGIFQSTAESRLGKDINFMQARTPQAQIDIMAGVLKDMMQENMATNPNFGLPELFAYYYTGIADPNSQSTAYGEQTPQQYVQSSMNELKTLDDWVRANGGSPGAIGGAGVGTINNQEWAGVNQWDSLVAQASAKYGVPANLIKSVIHLETGGTGNPNARHAGGATGLMQIMPFHNNGNWQALLDPATNIDMGTRILSDNFKRWGTWENAAKAYLAGNPYSTAVDANLTGVTDYWATIERNWNMLDRGAGGTGTSGQQQQPVTNINMVWGGMPADITQEHGPTAFSQGQGAWMYDYSIGLLGTRGHPGIDVGVPAGTQIFTPVSGTVQIVGSGSGYADTGGGPGQIMVELDNGHQIIFGHMRGSAVRVGDRVNAGQVVGTSGNYNGDHLHLEYRIPSTRFGGTQEAVDPREALMGVFSGTLSSPNQAMAGVGRAYTYSDLLKTAATGGKFFYGQPLSSGGSTWNSWLQDALKGRVSYGSPSQGELSGAATNGYKPRANPITNPW